MAVITESFRQRFSGGVCYEMERRKFFMPPSIGCQNVEPTISPPPHPKKKKFLLGMIHCYQMLLCMMIQPSTTLVAYVQVTYCYFDTYVLISYQEQYLNLFQNKPFNFQVFHHIYPPTKWTLYWSNAMHVYWYHEETCNYHDNFRLLSSHI